MPKRSFCGQVGGVAAAGMECSGMPAKGLGPILNIPSSQTVIEANRPSCSSREQVVWAKKRTLLCRARVLGHLGLSLHYLVLSLMVGFI